MVGRVQRFKRKKYDAYSFSVQNSYRNGHGKATHKVLKYFGTVKSTATELEKLAFWKTVDAELKRLAEDRIIYFNDIRKIVRKFEAAIPRPKIASAPAVNREEEILRELNLL